MTDEEHPGHRSISVLHVDDEPSFAEMVAMHLERSNSSLAVETADRAQAALDRLADEPIDCIVSDYQMPRMDGLELLDAVREEYPTLPFILFTGKGSEEVAAEAINRGVDAYLQKEVGTAQYSVLAQQITTLVEKVQAERRLATIEHGTHYPDSATERCPGRLERAPDHPDAQNASISEEVVQKVAEQEGTDPVDLPPLFEVIDPLALDRLVDPPESTDGTFLQSTRFTYQGYTLTITGDGTVRLQE